MTTLAATVRVPSNTSLLKTVLLGSVLSGMPFLEHLEELRSRILRALIALGIGTAICGIYAVRLVRFLVQPAVDQGIQLTVIDATEVFSVYFRVALAAGVCVSAPFVLWQVWRFIEPGLYPHEKRYAVPFLLSTSFCFVAGACMGFTIAPAILEVQAEMARMANLQYLPSTASYLYLLTAMIVSMGLIFEMPPVAFILSRIGLVDARFLLRNFKYAFLIFAIAAAILTPGGDIAPMLLFTGVMTGVYAVSIAVAALFGRTREP